MEHINISTVDHAIHELLEERQLTKDNLELFVLLKEARGYLCDHHHHAAELTEEDASKWVHGMHPAARWTKEQTTSVMRQHGWHYPEHVFWAVMNAMVSDYGDTMGKYGVDRTDLWADLAHDWLSDADAKADKAGLYWENIVSKY